MTCIKESHIFGLDIGISSCGWAVINQTEGAQQIEALGSWCFNVPETDKDRTPTNHIRRNNRLLRRVVRRRRHRMAKIRHLFAMYHLLDHPHPEAFRQIGADPWEMRAQGLDRLLTPQEFATALGHIAKRRGFESSAKRVPKTTSTHDHKMLSALTATEERASQYRTIGEMFARDPAYSQRRRNREGQFDRTMSRKALQQETRILFSTQRHLGSPVATPTIERAFTAIAFHQRPIQDSGSFVEFCPFEPGEKRSSRFSPSFEQFRLLCRLVNLRITDGIDEYPLTPDELQQIYITASKTRKLTGDKLRHLLQLHDHHRFTTIPLGQEKRDITSRTGESFPGTATFRSVLGDTLWRQLHPHPELLDQTAWIISFHELTDTITKELAKLGLPSQAYSLILQALAANKFAKFKGASSLSDKAARKLIPYLQQGLTYDKACEAVGYNHAASKFHGREIVNTKAKFKALMDDLRQDITNPIAKKAISEGMKQLWAMRNRWGLPGCICIELARDVGNSLEKRRLIERNIEARTKQREKERTEARALLSLEDVSDDILLRYRLWKEQDGRCCYTNEPIAPYLLLDESNMIQIDHILPWSRFGDSSYNNRALCFTKANQDKKNRTPYEWIYTTKGPAAWEQFSTIVEGRKNTKGIKKRNFLLKGNHETEKRFRRRNLNDTRYAARLIAEAAHVFYPIGQRAEKGGTRRVFTRPGALTAALRNAWDIESLKKIDGRRIPDSRHHALDATVVAAVNERELQKLTKSFQYNEQIGRPRLLRNIPPPWIGFQDELRKKYAALLVARPERRRARGEGHGATIRQIRIEETRPVIYERKAIDSLKITDLTKIKDPERNSELIHALYRWIKAGKPTNNPPRTPCTVAHEGHLVRKVRLMTNKRPAVPVRGGMADRGDMVRVDVFTMRGKSGKKEWFMVPIYRHHVMNPARWPSPPNRAILANKPEEQWPIMDERAQFHFSLYPRSYIRLIKNGTIMEGYFAGSNRATASIALANPNNTAQLHKGIGIKTLDLFQKFSINRFGELSLIKQETRTWHGLICPSPHPL